MRRSRSTRLLAGITMVLVAAAACSSGSEDVSSSPTNAVNAEETTEVTAAGIVADGEPIRIGFLNNEGGAFSVPELRVGSEVAQDHINNRSAG